MMTISLENLVVILPIGFESKNRIGALSTFSAILLCIFVEALIMNSKKINDLRKQKTMYPAMVEANMIAYLDSACYSVKGRMSQAEMI